MSNPRVKTWLLMPELILFDICDGLGIRSREMMVVIITFYQAKINRVLCHFCNRKSNRQKSARR